MPNIVGLPVYQNNVPELATTDPVHPTSINPTRTILIDNDVYLKQQADNPSSGVTGTATGYFTIKGLTSGTVTITVNAVAGTWTLKLPATPGTANYAFATDGAGNASWISGQSIAGLLTTSTVQFGKIGINQPPDATAHLNINKALLYGDGVTDPINLAFNTTSPVNPSLWDANFNVACVNAANRAAAVTISGYSNIAGNPYGLLVFTNYNGTTHIEGASIRANDNGTNYDTGVLGFYTRPSGGSSTLRFKIAENGTVTISGNQMIIASGGRLSIGLTDDPGSGKLAFANNKGIVWKDSGGTLRDVMFVDASNRTTIQDGAGASVSMQTDGGNGWASFPNGLIVTGSGGGAVANGSMYKDTTYGTIIKSNQGSSYDFALHSHGNTPGLRIDTSGLVYFPTDVTTASAANAFWDNSTAGKLLRSTSSRFYKARIRPLSREEYRTILKFDPVAFTSICESDDPDRWFWGLTAEQVDKALPSIFTHYADRHGRRVPDALMYDRMVSPLIALVKEHDDRLMAIEKQVGLN